MREKRPEDNGVGGGGDIIHRDEDQYEKEVGDDPEKPVHTVRASPVAVALDLAVNVLIGVAAGFLIWHYLHEKTFFIYKKRWMLQVLTASPAVLLFGLASRRAASLLIRRFAVSRRFIRSKVWVGFDQIDSCDMTDVLDVQMSRLGPFSTIKVITKDKTTPVIHMRLLKTAAAEALFGYITAHAETSYLEMRRSRRFNR